MRKSDVSLEKPSESINCCGFAVDEFACRSRSQSNRLNDRQTSKLFTEFPGHRKCRPNVPRIFDVCSELKSDCKSYFGFLVDKFSEAVKTEITTFSIIA